MKRMERNNVYRLLVVDDEPFITDSLANMLETAIEDKLDVYKAYSAFQALEYLARTSFDIMILDIQMPGMSGIELIKKVSVQWPSCRVVFLSGHDEFEYAYQAMQYHAVRYVLKNEGDEVLLDAIRQCIADIEREAISDALLARADEQMRMCMPILRREFLHGLLTGTMAEESERVQQFKRYGVLLAGTQPVILLAARRDDFRVEDLSTQVDIVIRAKLSHAARCEICCADSSFMLWLIQPLEGESMERAAVTVKGMAETIQRTCLQTLNASISFVFDARPCTWESLKEKSEVLRYAVECLLEKHSSMAFVDVEFFRINDLSRADDLVDKLKFAELKEKLADISWAMSNGDVQKFETLSSELTKVLEPHLSGDDLYILEIMNQMDSMLLSFVIGHDLKEQISGDPLFRAIIAGQPAMGDRRARLERFAFLGKRLMELWFLEQKDKSDAFVRNIDKYIQKHLGDDLSLVTLSEKVYLNPSYLSRRYKELTGKNITDTISEARMTRAAQLLDDEQYKVRNVAEMVGFASAAHFSRVFKKHTGMTPQEYRDNSRGVG